MGGRELRQYICNLRINIGESGWRGWSIFCKCSLGSGCEEPRFVCCFRFSFDFVCDNLLVTREKIFDSVRIDLTSRNTQASYNTVVSKYIHQVVIITVCVLQVIHVSQFNIVSHECRVKIKKKIRK